MPWSEAGVGPFAPVFVNDGLNLDFDEWVDAIQMIHFCFRVSEDEFKAILARIKAAVFRVAATCMGRSISTLTRSMAVASLLE